MMGVSENQGELFCEIGALSEWIPDNHILKKIQRSIDFSFVRDVVREHYGKRGNVSVDPVTILKMMLVLFLDDVSSERELMKITAYRLDYLWFFGFSSPADVPDHSVLSKARKRWGLPVFEELFCRVVRSCVEAGLVSGSKIHMDGSVVDANVSLESIVDLDPLLKTVFDKESRKLEDAGEIKEKGCRKTSKTDPEAKMGKGKGRQSRVLPRYKNHRAVDDQCGVITATRTTPGDGCEQDQLVDLIDDHERNTDLRTQAVVADAQYGTTGNFRQCYKRGIRSHMADLSQANKGHETRREGLFTKSQFTYDPRNDCYVCPAEKQLVRGGYDKSKGLVIYTTRGKTCANCHLREKCTTAKRGRRIGRNSDQEFIEIARAQSRTAEAKRDRRRRKSLMEGSFADATNNHGFKRSRWWGLMKQRIQDFLIATVQNLRKLFSGRNAPHAGVGALHAAEISGIAFFAVQLLCFGAFWCV